MVPSSGGAEVLNPLCFRRLRTLPSAAPFVCRISRWLFQPTTLSCEEALPYIDLDDHLHVFHRGSHARSVHAHHPFVNQAGR